MNWEEIVDQYGETIFRTAFQLLNDTHEAEDVAQEVLLEIYHSRSNTDSGLLRRMAAFRAIDRLRRKRTSVAFDETTHGGGSGDAKDEMMRRELGSTLRDAIARLPRRQSECFWLRYVEGLTYVEIASLQGVSVSAVSTALSNAKAKLRSILSHVVEGMSGHVS